MTMIAMAKCSGGLCAGLMALRRPAAGCFRDVKDETAGWSAEKLYAEAHEAMLDGQLHTAVKLFETLEGRAPARRSRSRRSSRAPTPTAKTASRPRRPPRSTASSAPPDQPDVDYALYLKGLVNFNDNLGLFGYVVRADLSERDQKDARIVRGVQGARAEVPGEPLRRGRRDAHALHRQLARQVRGARGAATTTAAAPTWRRPTARRRRCSTIREPASNERALDVLVKSYDKLGLTQLATTRARARSKNFPTATTVAGVHGRRRALVEVLVRPSS